MQQPFRLFAHQTVEAPGNDEERKNNRTVADGTTNQIVRDVNTNDSQSVCGPADADILGSFVGIVCEKRNGNKDAAENEQKSQQFFSFALIVFCRFSGYGASEFFIRLLLTH